MLIMKKRNEISPSPDNCWNLKYVESYNLLIPEPKELKVVLVELESRV